MRKSKTASDRSSFKNANKEMFHWYNEKNAEKLALIGATSNYPTPSGLNIERGRMITDEEA